MDSAQTYLYLCRSEKVLEQCGQFSERLGLLLGRFTETLLQPLDIESRGDADEVGGTPSNESGGKGCVVEDSVKAKGSDGQNSREAEGLYAKLENSKSASQYWFDRSELMNASSLSE